MKYKSLIEEFVIAPERLDQLANESAVAIIDEMLNKYPLNYMELLALIKAVREFER